MEIPVEGTGLLRSPLTKAYHCILPFPISKATKYWFVPMNILYLYNDAKTSETYVYFWCSISNVLSYAEMKVNVVTQTKSDLFLHIGSKGKTVQLLCATSLNNSLKCSFLNGNKKKFYKQRIALVSTYYSTALWLMSSMKHKHLFMKYDIRTQNEGSTEDEILLPQCSI